MASPAMLAQAMPQLPATDISTIESVPSAPVAAPGPMDPDTKMVIWTWVTFAIVALVLYKIAFKPIFAALEQREHKIRKAVEDADQARQQMEQIAQTRATLLAEADQAAKNLVEEARKAAREAARVIEEKAREEAKIQIENATREIRAASDKARAGLRQEAAAMAVGLAGKILDQELDANRQRQLVDKLMREV